MMNRHDFRLPVDPRVSRRIVENTTRVFFKLSAESLVNFYLLYFAFSVSEKTGSPCTQAET